MVRKPVRAAETRVDIADRLLAQVDAEVLLAGVLGATAALGGLTPPFTRMLQAVNEETTSQDYKDAILSVTGPGFVYVQSRKVSDWIAGLVTGNQSDNASVSPADKTKIWGLAASGALEGMILMSFVKNKDALSAVTGLAGQAIRAGGEALPF